MRPLICYKYMFKRGSTMRYMYLYKITNLLNSKYYIGIHRTNDMSDGYMGSGKIIKFAIEKYGIKNFKKEIIGFYDSEDSLFMAESEHVTTWTILDPLCYNISIGGSKPPKKRRGMKCKDPNSFIFKKMKENNPARLAHVKEKHKNTTMVKDSSGQVFKLKLDDPKIKELGLVSINKGLVTCKDVDGILHRVSIDHPDYISGKLIHISKNRKLVCPHCKKEGGNSMKRWHFNNCRLKELQNENSSDN